jgi:hypothetical protein
MEHPQMLNQITEKSCMSLSTMNHLTHLEKIVKLIGVSLWEVDRISHVVKINIRNIICRGTCYATKKLCYAIILGNSMKMADNDQTHELAE